MTTELDIDDKGWVEALPSYQQELIHELLRSGLTEEEAAEAWLSRVGPENNFGFGSSPASANYLSSVKGEFRKFVCGDPAYESLRADAKKIWDNSKYSIVSLAAVGIAAQIGVAVAVVTPVVALLFAAAGKIGLNAWCNMPPPPPATITNLP